MFGEVLVRVLRTLPLEKVAEIKSRIVAAVEKDVPRAEIVVAVELTQLDDETVLERVLLIAAKRRVPVHLRDGAGGRGRLSVSLDVEVDGRMSLGAAHGLASKLEGAIIEEFGDTLEIDTYIEPLRSTRSPGRTRSPSRGIGSPAPSARPRRGSGRSRTFTPCGCAAPATGLS